MLRDNKGDWSEVRVAARAAELIQEFEKKGQAPPGREQAPIRMTSQLKLYIKEKERKALIEKDTELRAFVRMVVSASLFQYFIMALILTNAVMVSFDDHSPVFIYIELIFFCVFLIEFMLKQYAERQLYWRSTYNVLDFLLLLISLIQIVFQTYLPYVNLTYLRVIRGLRALRTLRSITLFRSLQIVVNALANTIRTTVLDILVLLFLFMFLFSIIGYHFFGSDPNLPEQNFKSLGSGFLTSFVFVTADGWVDRQREMDELGYSLNRIFVVIFILIGNFIFTNLFIAVICKNIDEAQTAEKKLQRQKRAMLKKYKKELFARKQKDEIVQLMAHQRKMQNSNLQEVLKSLAGQLHHDDLQQMSHLVGDLTWLDTYMLTLNYHENAMYRIQNVHFALANTLTEIVDRRAETVTQK